MAKSVKWNLSLYVEDGPTLTSTDNIKTDAIDTLNISVEKNTTDKPIEVQPGDLGEVKLVYIKSDLHNDVKYKFNNGSADSGEVVLDKDHILTSGELVKLFGKSPNNIKFTNSNTETDAHVDIIIAREAH